MKTPKSESPQLAQQRTDYKFFSVVSVDDILG